MNCYSDAINYLPNEIDFFKTILTRQNDPIRKHIFNLNDLSYILKRISKFSIPSIIYFNIYTLNNEDKLLDLLCYSYLERDISGNKDYNYVKDFIYTFFDYDNAIYDISSSCYVWIYPKQDIRNFISKSIFQYEKDNIFYNEKTLSKLINIFANFTKFEYSNCDKRISSLFEDLNYPTLILANIALYEKGYITVKEKFNKIQLSLNKKNETNKNHILFKNRIILKKEILKFINFYENTKYSLDDFL